MKFFRILAFPMVANPLVAGAPRGNHPVSVSFEMLLAGVVPSIIERSCSRIPTTGRQKSWTYFWSQARMPASPIATFTSANSRAFWAGVLGWFPGLAGLGIFWATSRTIWL